MTTKTKQVKSNFKRIGFRYLDRNHRILIQRAARKAGLSINSWLIQSTLKQARKELS